MAIELSNLNRMKRALLCYTRNDTIAEAMADIDYTFAGDSRGIKSVLPGMTGDDIGISNADSEFLDTVFIESVLGPMQNFMTRVEFQKAYNKAMELLANWTGEGRPIPISSTSLTDSTLEPRKVATLAVVTSESLKQRHAEAALAKAQIAALRLAIEEMFLDPGNAGTSEMPAAITYGVQSFDATADIPASIAKLTRGFKGLRNAFYVTDPGSAVVMSSVFQDCGVRGGSIGGIPVPVTEASPTDSNGGQVALVDASRIIYARDALVFKRSNDSTIWMNSEFDSNGPGEAVGLFQTDGIALRSTARISWELMDPAGCRILVGCDW